ncbi:MAG: hypothetical protein AAB632_02560 [Patescibacteria group bacterium]
MKKIDLKMPNVNTAKMTKRLPQVLLLMILVIGILLLGFVYFIFTRNPENDVLLKNKAEIDEISIKFDKTKILNLFDSKYDISQIKDPSYTPKNPFLRY